MKNFIIILLITISIKFDLLLANQNDILLSPRVGNVISLQERNYFGLFPKINNFQVARLVFDDNNSYYFSITTDSNTIDFDIDEYQLIELNRIIDNYERIAKYSKLNLTYNEFNFNLVKKFFRNQAIYNKVDNIVITKTLCDEMIIGKLIYQDSIYLALLKDEENFLKKANYDDIVLVPVAEIYSINVLYNGVINGRNNLYLSSYDELNKYLLFTTRDDSTLTPPEVYNKFSMESSLNISKRVNYSRITDELNTKKFTFRTYLDFCRPLNSINTYHGYPVSDTKLSDYKIPSWSIYKSNLVKSIIYGFEIGYNMDENTNIGFGFKSGQISIEQNSENVTLSTYQLNSFYEYSINISQMLYHSNKYICTKDQYYIYFEYGIGLTKYFANYTGLEEDVFKQNNLAITIGVNFKYKLNNFMYFFVNPKLIGNFYNGSGVNIGNGEFISFINKNPNMIYMGASVGYQADF